MLCGDKVKGNMLTFKEISVCRRKPVGLGEDSVMNVFAQFAIETHQREASAGLR